MNYFYLVDSEGNVLAYNSNSNRLKDVFDKLGIELAYVQPYPSYRPNEPRLKVTKETTNAEWNKYYNDHCRYY